MVEPYLSLAGALGPCLGILCLACQLCIALICADLGPCSAGPSFSLGIQGHHPQAGPTLTL